MIEENKINWNEILKHPVVAGLFVKKKRDCTQFKATGDINVVQSSPLEMGTVNNFSSLG